MGWRWWYATLEEFPVYLIRGSWENSAIERVEREWKRHEGGFQVPATVLLQVLEGNYSDTHKNNLWRGENLYEL
jgi:hypothetical protein